MTSCSYGTGLDPDLSLGASVRPERAPIDPSLINIVNSMRPSSLLATLLLLLGSLTCLLSANQSIGLEGRVIRQQRHDHPSLRLYSISGRAASHRQHRVTFALTQGNVEVLKGLLREVSNVKSPQYGRYLSQQQIGQYIDTSAARTAVREWLQTNSVSIVSESAHGEYIHAEASVAVWEQLLGTQFHSYHFTHPSGGQSAASTSGKLMEEAESFRKQFKLPSEVVRAQSFSLPDHIHPHVMAVFKVLDMPPPLIPSPQLSAPHESAATQESFHQTGFGGPPFGDPIDSGNEAQFRIIEKSLLPGSSRASPANMIRHLRSNSQFSLRGAHSRRLGSAKIRYVTPTVLKAMYNIRDIANGYGSQSVYETIGGTFLAEDLASFQEGFHLPPVNVTSLYGALPNASAICTSPATIFQCAEASLDIQYIVGTSGNVPTSYYYDSDETGDFVAWITTLSAMDSPPLVNSISYGTYELYLSASELDAFNTESIKLALRGVTLIAGSGDDGVGGFLLRHNPLDECGYFAMFPASSPYVTAVGGTMGGIDRSQLATNPEVACTSNGGATITTGGGFSHYFTMPWYQQEAINGYFAQFNSSSTPAQSTVQPFVSSNRGYPDVSLASKDYGIIINRRSYAMSGTSASTPAFAGMISQINSYRIERGLSPLGLLNPLIYSHFGEFANDITQGSNECTADPSRCCPVGFQATPGWDPVTGHGSVDFLKLLAVLGGIPSSPPSSIPAESISGSR